MDKILIIDDEFTFRKTIERHLVKEGYEVAEAEDGKSGLDMVARFSPDVILLDVMMPVLDGFEVCQTLRDDFKHRDVFIIILSAKTESEDKVYGLDLGADDYIVKPVDPPELLARIRAGLRTLEAKRAAFIDPLTRLYNRYYFNGFVSQEIARCHRSDTGLSMLLLDIDHFKNINDTYGHSVGDEVLIELAGVLKENSRKTDVCVRWGGEEFILLLMATNRDGAAVFAEKTRSLIEKHRFPEVDRVTVSVGFATLRTNDRDLFDRVDKALYQAKNTGRNKVVGG
ncbi:MAG: diguanylate cyclase [Proteobacteria bacterium]|nr:diguanylate cyclase [Pseudomonadota bacterium]